MTQILYCHSLLHVLCYRMIPIELVQLIHVFVNVVMTENLQNTFCLVVLDFKKPEIT